ncbi:hypothetical protein [Corynebacterium sp. MNWGS58]|uniref:hypothetical protein n=1 Tax=Corynebacterium sp. 102791.4 TaxID=3104612 RepID=UPI003517F5CA
MSAFESACSITAIPEPLFSVTGPSSANKPLAEHWITVSTGTVGDSYDNALAENVNGGLTRMRSFIAEGG